MANDRFSDDFTQGVKVIPPKPPRKGTKVKPIKTVPKK